MKLYTFDSAPNPARLKMFIDYKGITVDTQQIDMAKAAQLDGSYTDIVPEATLPTLVLDDGTRLTEVIAIAHYLEAVYPERPLLGTTPSERGLILNWNHRIFNTLFMACAEAFRNGHPAYSGRALPGPQNVEQIPISVKGTTKDTSDLTKFRPAGTILLIRLIKKMQTTVIIKELYQECRVVNLVVTKILAESLIS